VTDNNQPAFAAAVICTARWPGSATLSLAFGLRSHAARNAYFAACWIQREWYSVFCV